MRLSARTILTLVLAVIAGIVTYWLVPAPLPELSRSEFMEEVRAGHVHKIEIRDQEIILGESTTRGLFRTSFDRERDMKLPSELRSLGIDIWYSKSTLGLI
jgi:hypothetical protein